MISDVFSDNLMGEEGREALLLLMTDISTIFPEVNLHSHLIVSNRLLVCVLCSDWLAETCCYLLSAGRAEMLLAMKATNRDVQYMDVSHRQ